MIKEIIFTYMFVAARILGTNMRCIGKGMVIHMGKYIVGRHYILWEGNGTFSFYKDDKKLLSFYGQAILETGEELDTRHCNLIKAEVKNEKSAEKEADKGGRLEACFQSEQGIGFTEIIRITGETLTVQCMLMGEDDEEVHVKRLIPMVMEAPDKDSPAFLRSLWTKMLLVPYDNTMWVRYEAVPLRPGRTSYDVTALFEEESREGIVIGAIDFELWKNGIICSGNDARVLKACSGIADLETHDKMEHGIVRGNKVASSRFVLLYGRDYRDLLEQYGDIVSRENPILSWEEGVPFGWNSWSGLAFRLNERNYREAGRFLREELMSGGYHNGQTTYVNLDAGWHRIPEETLIELVEELHSKGQKAGIYGAPFAWFGQEEEDEIPGVKGHCYREILLKDSNGNLLPRVDGAIPMDVTHPLWKQHMAWQAEQFLRWGFDYVKLDFLSHGAMEGVRYNKAVMTGRQAITEGYELLKEHFSEERAGHPFFISLSIAPLFPCGYGHARRFSCDAFGLAEDTEYVLNALTYAWWQSGRLYAFNDPDHISLYQSFCGDRNSLFGEARARYTAAVIAGTVMMISDDYGMGEVNSTAGESIERAEAEPVAGIAAESDAETKDTDEIAVKQVMESRKRARTLCQVESINRIAAAGKSFRPVEAAGTTAGNFFTLELDGKQYMALFHWKKEKENVEFDMKRGGLPLECSVRELWTDKEYRVTEGRFIFEFDGCDGALFEVV